MGDATVARELPPLLDEPSSCREAARLLAVLPADPANRGQPLHPCDAASGEWLHIAAARLGSSADATYLRQALPRWCAPDADAELCARAALAVADVAALASAVDRGALDEPLMREVIAALGRSHDPRALDPLMLALATVRTREAVVAALGELDDARALPTLLLWLPNDPYVPVRARMASLVAQLGKQSPAARDALMQLAAVENEPPVMAVLLPALHALGAPAVVELGERESFRAPPLTVAGGELWIVGTGSGILDVAAARVVMTDGVARLDTPHAVTVTVTIRRRDGDAKPRLAFSRRKP